ncbi:MAG TPA: glycosyltransferase family 2 protein [Mycobacteriales bacterium]|nr:glycosyltransferase family 2 protein [Mycobacteriales bacterium]
MAVIIVSYRSAPHLVHLLPRLPAAALAAVIVVDNASDDESVTVARSVPGVTVVANSANMGFGRACNVGASRAPAGADLLFLNPDADIAASDLQGLVGVLDDHPRCGLVGPRVWRGAEPLTSSGDEATVATELRMFAPKFIADRLPDRRHPADQPHDGEVAYVEGACMLVRRAAFDAVGGFDPAYFLFFEELDLGNRLRRAGWTVRTAAHLRAEHETAASRATTTDNARPALVESTVRYLMRWRGRRAAWTYATVVRGLWWLRVARGQLSRQQRRAYVRALAAARRLPATSWPGERAASSPPE